MARARFIAHFGHRHRDRRRPLHVETCQADWVLAFEHPRRDGGRPLLVADLHLQLRAAQTRPDVGLATKSFIDASFMTRTLFSWRRRGAGASSPERVCRELGHDPAPSGENRMLGSPHLRWLTQPNRSFRRRAGDGAVKCDLQYVPRAGNPQERLRGRPTEQQRESKGRRELYAGGNGLTEEDVLRPKNKHIMDEIDRIGAPRE